MIDFFVSAVFKFQNTVVKLAVLVFCHPRVCLLYGLLPAAEAVKIDVWVRAID